MNSFTWSTEENDWIFLGGQYNEDFNNWKGPINNGQFPQQNLKDMRIQRRNALSMQALSSLMGFLEKENQQYPSSPTRINAVSIRSEMGCGMSSPLQNQKQREGLGSSSTSL